MRRGFLFIRTNQKKRLGGPRVFEFTKNQNTKTTDGCRDFYGFPKKTLTEKNRFFLKKTPKNSRLFWSEHAVIGLFGRLFF